jgi:hypothetical protein
MHPSWRDLIIEHLVSSPKARFDFLRCCGTSGIQLALSRGGGIQGERQRPLLVTTADWQTLRATIKLRIANEAEDGVHAILSSIIEATLDEFSSHEEAKDATEALLHDIARDATLLSRERWDKSNEIISIDTLEIYCQLSETIDPLPPMPRLITTWNSYWAAAKDELTYDPAKAETNTYWLGKWIALIKCISGSEPRLLTQLKFPDCCMQEIQQFLEAVDACIERECDLRTREDYESEIELLTEIKIINRLGKVIPSIEEEISSLSARIESKRSDLDEELAEHFPEPDYDNSDSRPSGGISIEEIMSDL